jgi:trehalose-phosphatase
VTPPGAAARPAPTADRQATRPAQTADGPRSWPVSSPDEIEAALRALVGARPPLLVIADFDGTLAVGTRDPAAAVIHPRSQRALRALASLGARQPGRLLVVVLTGRIVADVAARTRVGGIEYHGDHGLQHARLARGARAEAITPSIDPVFDVHRDPAEALAAGVTAELGRPSWLFVERKGPSVAFHVRQAEDVQAARAAVVEAIGAIEHRLGLVHDLVHYRGRSVVDLRPRDAGGKREAVERLVAAHRPGGMISLGDEMSDIDAFEAVIAARTAEPRMVGLTVAVHGAGRPAPAELRERADLVLAGAPQVGTLLAGLARRLRSDGRRAGLAAD